MSSTTPLRSARAVNTVLIAAAASAVFLGSYGYSAKVDGGTASSSNSSGVASFTAPDYAPFTTADAGSCLNWDVAADGSVSNFQQTSCADPHRFEVASREDLSIYPTSEFGKSATLPNQERQAQLREELCQGATLQYLDGQFDPTGKYSIAPILPPAAAWAQGDRTMLCGLQSTDTAGIAQLTSGKVIDVDQANIAQPGECRAVDPNQTLRTVPCADPHQLETVSVINLLEQFPQGYPQVVDQNNYLAQRCTSEAEAYLGGEENLYQSTLQPYWGSVLESSWAGGTHSVNCSLIHVNAENNFSVLTGSAKAGREAMTVDGAVAAAPPARNPLRAAATPAP